ncbi:hypothetical protein ES703_39886 [subsurface metagenome]
MATEKPTTAMTTPAKIVESVTKILHGYTAKGELILPQDYSIDNALKSAWLVLQETVDKDKQPALTVCSQASIANAFLDMAVQGLNPAKKQMYFIVYGKKLMCMRSYFGTMAVAERVAKASDIWAEVVYEGDVFEYEINHNRKTVTKHAQKLENIKPGKIVAAYCVVEFSDGRSAYTEIMTMEQIKKSWTKSKQSGANSVHTEFPEEMCKRTIINRTCKPLINASSDSNLFLTHFNRTDEEVSEGELATEIEENANQEIIDIEPMTEGRAQNPGGVLSAKPGEGIQGKGDVVEGQQLMEPGF